MSEEIKNKKVNKLIIGISSVSLLVGIAFWGFAGTIMFKDASWVWWGTVVSGLFYTSLAALFISPALYLLNNKFFFTVSIIFTIFYNFVFAYAVGGSFEFKAPFFILPICLFLSFFIVKFLSFKWKRTKVASIFLLNSSAAFFWLFLWIVFVLNLFSLETIFLGLPFILLPASWFLAFLSLIGLNKVK